MPRRSANCSQKLIPEPADEDEEAVEEGEGGEEKEGRDAAFTGGLVVGPAGGAEAR
jgi:hypothetical protein